MHGMLERKKRPHAPSDYIALKMAVKRGAELAGALSDIAQQTRIDAATISRAGNVRETSHLPLDVAADIDKLCGEPVILRALAHLLGYELVKMGAVTKINASDLLSQTGFAAKESGEFLQAVIDMQTRGATPNNARRVITEWQEFEMIGETIVSQAHGVVAQSVK